MDNDRAYLSNDKDMIKFQYGEKIIRFRGPYSVGHLLRTVHTCYPFLFSAPAFALV